MQIHSLVSTKILTLPTSKDTFSRTISPTTTIVLCLFLHVQVDQCSRSLRYGTRLIKHKQSHNFKSALRDIIQSIPQLRHPVYRWLDKTVLGFPSQRTLSQVGLGCEILISKVATQFQHSLDTN